MANPREFMFIDSTSDPKSANEAVRVHVMRESHRARRALSGLQQKSEKTSHGQMTIFTSESSRNVTGETSRLGSTSSQGGVVPEDQLQRRTSTTNTATASPVEPQPSLSSADSSALSRIFQVTAKIRDPEAFKADLAALCDNASAPLNALRAITAFISSADTPTTTDNSDPTIMQLESQALEALQARIADTGDALHSNQTILTVLLLARLEHARQNPEVGAYHTAALEAMLAQRSGREVVAKSNAVLGVLLSVDVETLREYSPVPSEGKT